MYSNQNPFMNKLDYIIQSILRILHHWLHYAFASIQNLLYFFFDSKNDRKPWHEKMRFSWFMAIYKWWQREMLMIFWLIMIEFLNW